MGLTPWTHHPDSDRQAISTYRLRLQSGASGRPEKTPRTRPRHHVSVRGSGAAERKVIVMDPDFFGLQRPGLAFAEILVLLIAIAATVVAFRRVRPAGAWLLVPYALWTTFATVLNFTIWRMNA